MASVPGRAAPLPPKPGKVKVVRAMYRYDAQHSDELSFDEGDILYIIDMSDSNWWKAKCGPNTGLVPSNYVEENTESLANPLHEATKRGNLTFMRECIANNVSVNGLDKSGSTPLHWAAHAGNVEGLKILLGTPNCELNAQNKHGDTPLHSAAWKNHPEIIKILLERGARADIRNNENKSAYDLAKDPESAAVLQRASQRTSQDYTAYGDEQDSD